MPTFVANVTSSVVRMGVRIKDNCVEDDSNAIAIADAGTNIQRSGDAEPLHDSERHQLTGAYSGQAWCDNR